MKKILLLIIAPFTVFTSLFADTISQDEADRIVLEHLSKETQSYIVYAKEEVQKEMVIITSTGELLEINYFCWVYFVNYIDTYQGRYLIVKWSNGNLLEVNAKHNIPRDLLPEGLIVWRVVHYIMDAFKGEWSWFKTDAYLGTVINEFKSIIKILNQNEDGSINYEVFVEDTLFYKGSFQILSDRLDAYATDIKLPHYSSYGRPPRDNHWGITHRPMGSAYPTKELLMFLDGYFEGYNYYYERIK